MIDYGIRIKNRIHATHDLNKLWKKLRKEGFEVWEDEDYVDNSQTPYHLYHVEKPDENLKFVADCLYRDKTEKELLIDKELGTTPFLQEIQWVKY